MGVRINSSALHFDRMPFDKDPWWLADGHLKRSIMSQTPGKCTHFLSHDLMRVNRVLATMDSAETGEGSRPDLHAPLLHQSIV